MPWAGWGGARLGAQALSSCCSQNCSQLIQTIEDTGTIMREVRDLEEQVRPGGGRGNQGRPGDSSVCPMTGYGSRHSLWLESLPCPLAMQLTWKRSVACFELQLLPQRLPWLPPRGVGRGFSLSMYVVGNPTT